MTKELDEKLCKEFPHVFRQRNGDKMETCMCWGFECADGWYDLLYRCSAKIERAIIQMKKDDPTLTDEDLPCASQIKEKFGTLRFYMHGYTDEIDAATSEAENESEVTCEECGKAGTLRQGGWMVTLCDACQDKRENPKEENVEHEDV